MIDLEGLGARSGVFKSSSYALLYAVTHPADLSSAARARRERRQPESVDIAHKPGYHPLTR